MLPLRDDIAVPDLPPEGTWIGKDPGKMAPLAAKGPVLVHFFDFSQLNSVRTLPYLIEWHRRYEPLGLRVIGVQAPRFPFGSDPDEVRRGLEKLGVGFPVIIDDQRILWNSYGCEGWPSLFLWGRGGRLKWFQFGEGEYRSTEEAIQASLAGPPDRCSSDEEGAAADREKAAAEQPRVMPEPMAPLRPSDAEGVKVIAPGAELMPAGDRAWTIADDDDSIEIQYDGGGIHVTAEGQGEIILVLDGSVAGSVLIDGPGLYTLAEHDSHGTHLLEMSLKGSPEIWSFSFSPAPA
jgi:hypothetical protein